MPGLPPCFSRKSDSATLRLDLHVHSSRSPDGVHAPRTLVKQARRVGLDGLAITDHQRPFPPRLARELSREFDLLVIPGIEGGRMATERHWIGLGPGVTLITGRIEEIIAEIRNEGGLSIAPHPFTRLGYVDYARLGFDAVEGFNASTPRSNRQFVLDDAVPRVGSTDAHSACWLGAAWTEIATAEAEVEAVLEAIRCGRCAPAGRPVVARKVLRHVGELVLRHATRSPLHAVRAVGGPIGASYRAWGAGEKL
jgi:predicted metal-dependent phosphoesterase TrpH